jgi:hypothetical protein
MDDVLMAIAHLEEHSSPTTHRNVTMNDMVSKPSISSLNSISRLETRGDKVDGFRKQVEYGAKKRIKP